MTSISGVKEGTFSSSDSSVEGDLINCRCISGGPLRGCTTVVSTFRGAMIFSLVLRRGGEHFQLKKRLQIRLKEQTNNRHKEAID